MLGCVAFTSCKTDVSTSNQLSLIPGEASIVFEINGNKIFEKSGLNNPGDYKFMNMLNLFNNDAYLFLTSIFKGSKDAGISAEKVVVYATKLPDFGIIMPLIDKTSFENWLKKSETSEPSDEKDFRYISEDGMSVAWNDNLVIISRADTREKIADQFKTKENALLATSVDFQEFAKRNTDVRLWVKYGSFLDIYKDILGTSAELDDWKNITIHSYLNFEDGKITGSVSLYPPEEVENIKKKFPVLKEFNKDILKDVPEQSYLAFNLSINVKEYLKIIRQNIETIIENAKSLHGYDIEDKTDEIYNFFESPDLNSVVEALGGDAILSIHGFNQGLITYPLASASFTVNGESAFKTILALIPKNLYKSQDGYYATATEKTIIPVYFAYKNDRVFVSNDLTVTKKFVDGAKDKTFADNPVSKAMTDKTVLYLNLDFESYPSNLRIFLQNVMGQQFTVFTSVIEIYESWYFSSDKDYNMESVLQLKNTNVNSLKQILKSIDKIFSPSAWMD
jgi:hypothetical protein